MPWVKFHEAFDWKPRPNVTIAFLPGQVKLVPTACASAAEAAGRGRRTTKPESEQRHGSQADSGTAS